MTIGLSVLCYVLIGLLSGLASGLLGIGGGIIAVPALLFTFDMLGFPQTYVMHLAIGTSLASMVINTFSASLAHNTKKAVHGTVVMKMIPGALLGAFLGSETAHLLSSIILQIIFGLFACAVGIHFLKPLYEDGLEHRFPRFSLFTLASTAIGMVSNILGIGGGVFTVPFLSACGMQHKKAIGTSALVSFVICLIGTIFYLMLGWKEIEMPMTVGFIYLPAFLIIGVVSYFSAITGAKLAHELSTTMLRRIFAFAMIAIGLSMIFL